MASTAQTRLFQTALKVSKQITVYILRRQAYPRKNSREVRKKLFHYLVLPTKEENFQGRPTRLSLFKTVKLDLFRL